MLANACKRTNKHKFIKAHAPAATTFSAFVALEDASCLLAVNVPVLELLVNEGSSLRRAAMAVYMEVS